MLLRFSLENFRSFRGPAELSFVATARKDEPSWTSVSRHVPHGVLPVVGVWGANASGKSNLLGGLLELQRLVRDSWTRVEPHAAIPWSPWRLRREAGDPSTRMELDLLIEGDVRISFGVKIDARGVAEEWLFRWESSRRQVLFHRNHDEADPWYFGPAMTGPRAQIAKVTRANSLFLSAAAQHNHPALLPIYEAIVEGMIPERGIALHGYPLFSPEHPLLAPSFRPALLRLLASADLGVVDLRTSEVKPEWPTDDAERMFRPEFIDEVREQFSAKARLVKLHLKHGSPGDPWELPPELESRGTHVFLARVSDVVEALLGGRLLVFDEIDTSLHPDLCEAIVGIFADPRSNPKGAQLLFTTHDRGLLGRLRTDEVVLVDKDREGVSQLAVASDFRGLRSRDDMRRAHEQGRLRGVPVLGDLAGLVADGVREHVDARAS